MPIHRWSALVVSLLVSGLACGGGAKPQTQPELAEHSLSGLAAQHIVLLPTYSIRVMPGLPWSASIGRPLDVQRTLDADLLAAFDERGLRKTWIFPEDLQASFKRNASYAADPYGLAEEPLRSPALNIEQRLPEPLASQLRTLVALHEDARLILAPVEVRFEPVGTGGRARACASCSSIRACRDQRGLAKSQRFSERVRSGDLRESCVEARESRGVFDNGQRIASLHTH